MSKEGLVEWVDPAAKTTVVVYWKKPAEWGELIYKWASSPAIGVGGAEADGYF